MTAIQLYKFIDKNRVEWHWGENPDTNKRDVVILPRFSTLEELSKLLGYSILSEGGIECRMLDGGIGIWMDDVCDHFGIEMEEVFGEMEEMA